MTCVETQERLYENAGRAKLPADLKAHVISCDSCRAVWDDLRDLSMLADESPFLPTEAETERLVAAIYRRIDSQQRGKVAILPSWLQRLAPLAAAAALVAVMAISGDYVTEREAAYHDSLAASADDIELYSSAVVSDDDLDINTIESLIEDYTAHPASEPSSALLKDLTEDELQYLTENFDVGELL